MGKVGKNPAALYRRALGFFEKGDHASARKAARSALKALPQHGGCKHLLGLIDARRGDYGAAAGKIEQALNHSPDNIEYRFNYACVLGYAGRMPEASAAYRKVIELSPGHFEARYNLGMLLRDAGNGEDALDVFTALAGQMPDHSQVQLEFGNTLKMAGRLDEAMAAYTKAVSIDPGFSEAYYNSGIVLRQQGKPGAALVALDHATRIRADFADAYFEKGNVLLVLGDADAALASFTLAIQYDPQLAEARSNRGRALFELGRIGEALLAYNRAIAINPGLAEVHCGLGSVLMAIGRLQEAEQSFRNAMEIRPDYSEAHSNLLFLQAAQASVPPEELLMEQRRWDSAHAAAEGYRFRFTSQATDACHAGRLRIGYVSADLYRHSVSYFFEPLLSAHDTSRFEIFCYDVNPGKTDETTQRLRALTEHWRSVSAESDRELANIIHADRIDVLVDLTGHFDGGRLKAFSYRPAPIQVSYLGYIAATGLESIDYWITDQVLHGEDCDERTVESIYRLPRCSFCYLPPKDVPAVSPQPNTGSDVMFGSFGNLSKLSDELVMTWCRILKELPGSRLMVMDKPLRDPGVREDFLGRFARHGVDSGQLVIRGVCMP